MPRYGRTTAAVMPVPVSETSKQKDDKKFLDKESQKQVDKVRREHKVTRLEKNYNYNSKIDQQRIWSERSPDAYLLPYKSLGRGSHLDHPQITNKAKGKNKWDDK